MIKTIAVIFGIIFIIVGILGFVPHVTYNQALFGIFKMNALHNLIHIVTGIVAIWVGCVTNYASRIFFQVFGIIYAIVAILGFVYQDEPIFGIIANNVADAWLHVVIAVFSLIVGFGTKAINDDYYSNVEMKNKDNNDNRDTNIAGNKEENKDDSFKNK